MIRTTVAMCLSLLLFPIQAQRPPTRAQQQPIFRAGANFVAVDVYARLDGRVVEGLSVDDFRVFEDGVEQAVETFEFFRVEPYTPLAARRDPRSIQEAERLVADPRHRVFVLYLDGQHVEHIDPVEADRKATGPVLEFLRRGTGPSDLFGVMTSAMVPRQLTFGRRLEAVEEAVAAYWQRVTAIRAADRPGELVPWPESDVELLLSRCRRLDDPDRAELVKIARVEQALDNLRALGRRLGSIRDFRSHVMLFTGGWVLEGPHLDLRPDSTTPPPGIAVQRGRLGVGAFDPGPGADQAVCDAEIRRLAELDTQYLFDELLESAGESNVSFHPIDPQGVATFDDPQREAVYGGRAPAESARTGFQTAGARLGTLRTLAHETDGTALVGTDDIIGPLQGLVDGLASFYVLGYYSTNTEFDGEYRTIEVRTSRDDLELAARRGYLAPTPEERARMEGASEASADSVLPVGAVEALSAIGRVDGRSEFFASAIASQDEVAVVVEVADGVLGRAVPEGAEVRVALTSDSSDTRATARAELAPGARGVRLSLPLVPGDAGPWRAAIEVDGTDGPVSDYLDVTTVEQPVIGEPAVYRARAARSSPIQPAAQLAFRRTERIHIEWLAFGPLERREARLLGPDGKPLPVAVTLSERVDGPKNVLVADLGLAPLAAGDYLIEVTASANGETARRFVGIRITR